MKEVSPGHSQSIEMGGANEIQGLEEMVDENSWGDTVQDRLALTPICEMEDHREVREDGTAAT